MSGNIRDEVYRGSVSLPKTTSGNIDDEVRPGSASRRCYDPSNRTNKRRVLGQRQMRADIVVVGGIGVQDLTQVGFAKE